MTGILRPDFNYDKILHRLIIKDAKKGIISSWQENRIGPGLSHFTEASKPEGIRGKRRETLLTSSLYDGVISESNNFNGMIC